MVETSLTEKYLKAQLKTFDFPGLPFPVTIRKIDPLALREKYPDIFREQSPEEARKQTPDVLRRSMQLTVLEGAVDPPVADGSENVVKDGKAVQALDVSKLSYDDLSLLTGVINDWSGITTEAVEARRLFRSKLRGT